MMRRIFISLVAVLLACAVPRPVAADGIPGDFDFYVLALSWSPSYCLIDGSADDAQCGVQDYGFIVHGLWPQYENGFPEYCRSSMGGWVSNAIIDSIFDIMPDGGLIGSQWRKHGICTGLRQEAYFDRLREAFGEIVIPDGFRAPASDQSLDPATIERAFLDINPGLTARGISVTCKQQHLADVRICLTKDLEFRECREVDRNTCRSRRIDVPAVR